jgi:hypothetical protein
VGLAIGRAEDGSPSLKVSIVNTTGRPICVLHSARFNPRVTLYRRGVALPRQEDFEPRPRSGCPTLPAGGRTSFDYSLKRLYPTVRAGDRLCYMLQWDREGGTRSISYKRQCIVFR